LAGRAETHDFVLYFGWGADARWNVIYQGAVAALFAKDGPLKDQAGKSSEGRAPASQFP
jgi:hypothetical protein